VREGHKADRSFRLANSFGQSDERRDAGRVVICSRRSDHGVVMRAHHDDLVIAANLAFDVDARIERVPRRRRDRLFDELGRSGVGARSGDVALADVACQSEDDTSDVMSGLHISYGWWCFALGLLGAAIAPG